MGASWIEGKVDELLAEVAELGMVLDPVGRPLLRAQLRARVRDTAARLRVSERTARAYFDRDALHELAAQLVMQFHIERPGLDITDPVERDAVLSRRQTGVAVAALAEALRVRVANDIGPASITEIAAQYADLIAVLGAYLTDAGDLMQVPVASAWLHRAARQLDNAADVLDAGGALAGDTEGVAPAELAAKFRQDATTLGAVADAGYGRPRPVD